MVNPDLAAQLADGSVAHDPPLPPLWCATLPILTVFVANWCLAQIVLPRLDLGYLASSEWGDATPSQVIGLWALIGALTGAIVVLLVFTWTRLDQPRETLIQGAQAALLPLFNTAALVGFGAGVAGLPAFGIVTDLTADMAGSMLTGLAVQASLLAGLTGSASGGMSIALDTLGPRYLEAALAEGVDPAARHRIVALATGGLDALPHNGAVVTLLGIAGLAHKEAYGPIFMVAVVIPIIALLAALFLSQWIGVF